MSLVHTTSLKSVQHKVFRTFNVSWDATTLALSGTPPYVIQAIGRWVADKWQKYVHKYASLQQALLHGVKQQT